MAPAERHSCEAIGVVFPLKTKILTDVVAKVYMSIGVGNVDASEEIIMCDSIRNILYVVVREFRNGLIRIGVAFIVNEAFFLGCNDHTKRLDIGDVAVFYHAL